MGPSGTAVPNKGPRWRCFRVPAHSLTCSQLSLLCKLICAFSFARSAPDNSCANNNRLLHALTRVCAREQNVLPSWRKEMEEEEEEEGRGDGERTEDQVRESHSETFRLKQCQHIPIIPVHSLSLSLSLSVPLLSILSAPSHPVSSPFY